MDASLPGIPAPPKRGRGRPKGSVNKRSGDLRQFVEARYGGLTPGQQAASIGLVTDREVRAAGGSVQAAMLVKAKALALSLEIKPVEAWALMQKERADLMPYIHQRLAQLDITTGGERLLPTIIMPDTAPLPTLDLGEGFEIIQGVSADVTGEVSQPKSHADEQPLIE